MKKLLCKLFGHKPPVYAKRGWWSPGEQYGVLSSYHEDGIGRIHVDFYAKCARCNQVHHMGKAHIVPSKVIKHIHSAHTLEQVQQAVDVQHSHLVD